MPKLGDEKYDRPDQTYTDKLTTDEIKQKLEDYKKVTKIEDVPTGTHVRYFIKKDNKMLFRLGGIIISNTGLPEYIVLGNGGKTWSVQIKNTVFFSKISLKDVQKEYEEIIFDKDAQIKGLIMENKEINSQLNKYKKKYGKI